MSSVSNIRRVLAMWQTPSVPNFIIGSKTRVPCPIENFSRAELQEIGRRWTVGLVTKALKRREDRAIQTAKASIKPTGDEVAV